MQYELCTHPTHKGKIFLVDMTKEPNYIFSELTKYALQKAMQNKKTILLIINKKGYTAGAICMECGYIPQCKNCSISIAYHHDQQKNFFGLCHICKKQYVEPKSCERCNSEHILHFGYGIQQVADYIQKSYNIYPLLVDSTYTLSPKKIAILQKTISHAPLPKVLVGTSLLSIPPKDTKIDIVVVLSADQGLHIPNYTATKNTFTMLDEVIRNYLDSTVIIQSFQPHHYSIYYACMGKKDAFEKEDAIYRQQYNYPPYADLVVVMYKHEIEQRLHNQINKVYHEILYYQEKYGYKETIEIYTTPPLIYKKFGKYRYNIIVKGKNIKPFMDIIYTECKLLQRGFKIDRLAELIV